MTHCYIFTGSQNEIVAVLEFSETLPHTTQNTLQRKREFLTSFIPSRVLGLVRPSWTTGFSRMAWNSGLLVSIPLSRSSGEGFLSPSSHSHCRREKHSKKPNSLSVFKNALISLWRSECRISYVACINGCKQYSFPSKQKK